MSVASAGVPVDPTVRHPFGLPMGTIRGVLALLICGFVWLVLLWPHDGVKLPLAHFFLASLVFLAFVTHPGQSQAGGSSVTSWILRLLFAGGSIGVLVFLGLNSDWRRVTDRLVPDVEEFRGWWLAYLAVVFGAFLGGQLLRLVFGNQNPFFQSVRAWLSVLALLMMLGEFLLFMAFASASSRPEDFLHVWQAVQLGAVSAYFGART